MGIENPPPVNGDFVNEGTFLALPPCFPGVSLPPPADETRAHRLFRSASGKNVFAATRGPVPHVLQFRPKGTFGYAADLGVPSRAIEITALLSRETPDGEMLHVACAGDGGACIHRSWTANFRHGIQEWEVRRHPFEKAIELPVGTIEGMVGSGTQIFVWGEEAGFFLRILENGLALEKSVPLVGVLGALKMDGADRLLSRDWRLLPVLWERIEIGEGEELPIRAPLPQALHAFPRGFVFADVEGRITEWTDCGLRPRGRVPLTPVHALCRLPDGRIYASAGQDIAHWYVIAEEVGWARDLGVPVSTLTTRRYGLQFSHLMVGSDGEILAAEDDRNGHLWIYFPAPHNSSG